MRLVLLLSLLITFQATSQLSVVENETDYRFWINLPSDSILKSNPPILVFLHGRSLSGNDINRVKKYGVIHEIEKGMELPAIVVAPQVVSGSWDPDKILEVVQYVQSNYQTDSSRIYVCGMSLGGYGTMHFAGKYPEIVTAGVALCGGGNESDACNLSQIPFWIQHGTADEAVSVEESRKMVRAIESCNDGENLIYTEIKGANHGALEKAFRTSEIYDWMFEQVK